MNDAAIDGKPFGGHAKFFGSKIDQDAARLGGGDAQLLAAILYAGRTGRAALVDAGGGVAHHDLDGLEWHVELFRNHLRNGDGDALAHVYFAEEGQNRAVGINGDVGR